MTAAKKIPIEKASDVKVRAANFRAEFIASAVRNVREVLPVSGRLYLDLSGPPIPFDRLDELFGPSRIDIPELRQGPLKKD